MVGTNLKAETVKLMDQRAAIETELNAVIQRLCQPVGPGLSGDLVDYEGFPRSDIDIHAVRADRKRVAELKNDHRDVTEKISKNILLLHAAKPRLKSSATSTTDEPIFILAEKPMEIDGQLSFLSDGAYIPFALVDEITESSPADEDGLQLGDQIVKFGSVESGENILPMLAQEVQTNQGSAISVTIMRNGAISSLSVIPRLWQGRGLLGCHFKLL